MTMSSKGARHRDLRPEPNWGVQLKLAAASFGPPELAYDTELVMSMATISPVDMAPIGS